VCLFGERSDSIGPSRVAPAPFCQESPSFGFVEPKSNLGRRNGVGLKVKGLFFSGNGWPDSNDASGEQDHHRREATQQSKSLDTRLTSQRYIFSLEGGKSNSEGDW
jgi:hypothetical protein